MGTPSSGGKTVDLKGKVAIVTGGGTGIGAAITRRFIACGARVCIAGRRREKLDEVAGSLPEGSIKTCPADVSIEKDVERILKTALSFEGGLHVLVNNAALDQNPANVVDMDVAEWRRMLEVNLTGPFLMMKACIPEMVKAGGGSVINISSLAGLRCNSEMPAFCATKGGLINLAQQVALDYGPHKVRCNVVCPGATRTDMFTENMEAFARMLGTNAEDIFARFMEDVPLSRVAPFGPEFPFMNAVEGAAIQPVLWVDPEGQRFCDEGIAYYDTSLGNVNSRYKQGYTFCLFDDTIKKHFAEKGVFRGMGTAVHPGSKLENLDEELAHFLSLDSKEFFGADSIEELARKMEVDPRVLKTTVDRYNTFCAQGYDKEFAKDREYLLPLYGPRFYAAKARTCFLGTLGGIKINDRTEAVDEYGSPIAGLYVAGLDTGGLHAESYSMRDTSGITSAFAVNSGRIAGENAARYLKR